jgi:hypothetical protein
MLRRLVSTTVLIASLAVATACSGSSSSSPTSGADTAETDQSTLKNDTSRPWRAAPPDIAAPGKSGLLSLTKDEICNVVDPAVVLSLLGITGTPTSLDWRQSEASSECSAKVAVGDEVGFVEWRVGRRFPALQGAIGTSETGTTTELKISGLPARQFVDNDGTFAYVTVDTGKTWIEALVRDLTVGDTRGLAPYATALVEKLTAMSPAPQPKLDATVGTPFALSAGQVCSLMSNNVLQNTWKLRTDRPQGNDVLWTDSYAIADSLAWCTRGLGTTRVTISNEKPYDWEGTEPTESGYTQPTTFGDVSGLRRRELDDAGEFLKTIATVPFREFWVEVEIAHVPEGKKLDAILQQEVTEVLARLDRLVLRA